ncbi:MAG TPA: rhamnogalacturonan acetylesterase [Opitutaceae bacterium]|nr:rhamnogalacturonan acetylesterase [Opitutaceae bacterium]
MKLPIRSPFALLATALVLLGGAARLFGEDAPARASAPTPAAPTTDPTTAEAAASARGRGGFRLPEPANPKLPSLFLVGDSTMRNGRDDGQGKGAEGQWGWGHTIADLFDPAKINVVNRAVGGLSSRTYLTLGHWERVMAMLKPGDFVIIQLGTNDDGALNDEPPGPLRARGTIHGVGEETKEIDNVMTKKHEVVHTYGWYIRQFVRDAKSKGATPVVCSIIPRKAWDENGRARRNSNYEEWAKQVAEQEKVGFIDLNEIIARKYDELGHDAVMKLFPAPVTSPDGRVVDEHTHTNLAGAELNAACVVAGLKALHPDPLAPYFSARGQAVAAVDLSQPEPVPAKPAPAK